MTDTIEIKNLSKEEKLRVMEAIWEDLSRDEETIESPDWHRDVLQETKSKFDSDKEAAIDWQQAKNDLRKRFE